MAGINLYVNNTLVVSNYIQISGVSYPFSDTIEVKWGEQCTASVFIGVFSASSYVSSSNLYMCYAEGSGVSYGFWKFGATGPRVTFNSASDTINLHMLTGASFSDTNIIDTIQLPSGNTYTVADSSARNVINKNFDSINDTFLDTVARTALTGSAFDSTARQAIAGGVSFDTVWTKTDFQSTTAPSATKLASIPTVTVYYNNGSNSATGTLSADSNTSVGKFFLIYSKESVTASKDIYEEYVSAYLSGSTTKSWEKIGDSRIVSLNKKTVSVPTASTVTIPSMTITPSGGNTADVIGSDATFALHSSAVNITSSPVDVIGGSATLKSSAVSIPTVNTSYVNIHAAASTPTLSTVDTVEVNTYSPVTKGLATASAVQSISETKYKLVTNTMYPCGNSTQAMNGMTANTNAYLETTSITGISGSTTASKATAGTAVSVAKAGTSTTVGSGSTTKSTSNSDILKSISVTNGVLVIGAATLGTKSIVPAESNGSITPYSFADVTVPVAATSSTTVATGTVGDSTLSSHSTSDIIATVVSGITPSMIDVATKGSQVTFATGGVTSDGTGGSVLVGVTPSSVTVATGALTEDGTGTQVVSDISGASAGTAIKSATVSAPTITLSTPSGTSAATGDVRVASSVTTGTSSVTPTISFNSKDTKFIPSISAVTIADTTVDVTNSDEKTVLTTAGSQTSTEFTLDVNTSSTSEVLLSTTSIT